MKISIITLFPEVFSPILSSSILKRAQAKGKTIFELINLREFGDGKHQVVDGRPYGGGPGMILRADILAKAIKGAKVDKKKTTIILTSASGNTYNQKKAYELSKLDHLIIICGHYEGVDQRIVDLFVDEEISIGDYILTGGEIPAMIIADSVVRLIPGVLEKEDATRNESFSQPTKKKPYILLEYPQYTRPDKFENKSVPKVLLSGNHGEIEKWRQKEAIKKTKKVRPELLTR